MLFYAYLIPLNGNQQRGVENLPSPLCSQAAHRSDAVITDHTPVKANATSRHKPRRSRVPSLCGRGNADLTAHAFG